MNLKLCYLKLSAFNFCNISILKNKFSFFLLFFILILCFKTSNAQITINGSLINPSRPLVIGYWDKEYVYILDTVKTNKKRFFENKYAFTTPTHIWINSQPYAFIMPGDTLTLTVKGDDIQMSGSAAPLISFVHDLRNELLEGNSYVDYNELTEYAIRKSQNFFSQFKHKQKSSVEKLNQIDLILTFKFSPLLVKYNNEQNKMDSLAKFIRLQQDTDNYTDTSDLLRFIDRLDFKSDVMTYHAALNDINNLIRIFYINYSTENTTLQATDRYLVETEIINSIFKDGLLKSALIRFNLYQRIRFSENLDSLLVTANFLNELEVEDGSKNVAPLKELYKRKNVELQKQ